MKLMFENFNKLLLTKILFPFLLFWVNSSAQKVKVSSFYDDNLTEAIEMAVRSSADTVIIDLFSSSLKVKPLKFTKIRNKVILFEKDVVLETVSGAFPNTNDALLLFSDCENITVLGNKAKLRMNKKEYVKGEWRHGISIRGSSHITIKDLTISDSGGDGIYIAGSRSKLFSDNILISGVNSINNKRQGISIISAKKVAIKNCLFADTKGTYPGAGLDIEPNKKEDVVSGISVSNCTFKNNFGPGILVALGKLDSTSSPISVLIDSCLIENNYSKENTKAAAELKFGANKDNPVKGMVTIKKSLITNSNWGVIYSRKRADAYSVQLKNCMVRNVSGNGTSPVTYLEVPDYYNLTGPLGGFVFQNLFVENSQNVHFITVRGSKLGTLRELKDITVDATLKGTFTDIFNYINYNHLKNNKVDVQVVKLQ